MSQYRNNHLIPFANGVEFDSAYGVSLGASDGVRLISIRGGRQVVTIGVGGGKNAKTEIFQGKFVLDSDKKLKHRMRHNSARRPNSLRAAQVAVRRGDYICQVFGQGETSFDNEGVRVLALRVVDIDKASGTVSCVPDELTPPQIPGICWVGMAMERNLDGFGFWKNTQIHPKKER